MRARESIRVLIVAAHALERASYRALLERDERIQLVGEAAGCERAIALARGAAPDVALLDLGLVGLDDVGTAADIVSDPSFADIAVMLIAAREDDERVFSAVRAGALGVVSKDAEPSELVHAVRVLAGGDALLPAVVVRGLLAEVASRRGATTGAVDQLDGLTDREREVVALVATGLTNGEIAAQLAISPATAKTHVSRAMVKLGARDRAKLVVLAHRSGVA